MLDKVCGLGDHWNATCKERFAPKSYHCSQILHSFKDCRRYVRTPSIVGDLPDVEN